MADNGRAGGFDQRKFDELVLYIALRSADDPTYGATKLNKLLFYSDFLFYSRTGSSITGAEYQRLDRGPAPRQVLPAIDRLRRSDAAELALHEYEGYPQKRLVALREPDLTSFSAEEISLVDLVIAKLLPFNASEISEKTHRLPGWQLASTGETIPYYTVCISSEPVPLSEAEISYGRDVVAATINAACGQ